MGALLIIAFPMMVIGFLIKCLTDSLTGLALFWGGVLLALIAAAGRLLGVL